MPLRFRVLSPAPAAGATARAAADADALVFELSSDPPEVRLGRQPGSEIELPFPPVSLAHARLFRGESPSEWWLEDLGSTNGTWLDGARLQGGRPVSLRGGQRIRLATVEVVFEGWSAETRGDPSTSTIARRMISDLFGAAAGEAAVLIVESGPAHRDQLRLDERERRYVAGRADTCDLVLASEHASREHALFLRRWEGVFVEDLASRNGVKVDGQLIAGRARLGDGARIEVGGTVLRLDDPEDRYLQELAARDDAAPSEPAPPSDRGAPAWSKAPTSSAPGGGATPSLGHATAAAATALSAPTRVRRASARAGALRPATNVPRRPQPSRARTAIIVAATALLVLATSGLIVLLTRWT
jgi:pSer/pThr/pTyr-binding forkhead associated (FHA) protein